MLDSIVNPVASLFGLGGTRRRRRKPRVRVVRVRSGRRRAAGRGSRRRGRY